MTSLDQPYRGNRNNKGNPKVVSETEGEEITPQNPEVVKQFPVDTTDKEEVEEVENATE